MLSPSQLKKLPRSANFEGPEDLIFPSSLLGLNP
jgi:hypothetical protein